MKARKMISAFMDMFLILLFIYLLVSPASATEISKTALEFCAKSLIPSLFIYMVLAKTIVTSPISERLMKIIGLEPFLLVMGTLCGAPVGAKSAMTLYEKGRISKKHAEYLCAFTNNASMSFVVGFVGNELLGDPSSGVRLLIYQLTASCITALILKPLIFGKEKIPMPIFGSMGKAGLREAVYDSGLTMVNLCGCVIFFMVSGSAISEILKLDATADAVLKSILEFSSGCASAMNAGVYSFPIIAFAIGQTGLSVMLQVKSVTANRLSVRPFLLGKLVCCSLMTAMAIIFG